MPIYTDIDLSLKKHPVTGDVLRLYDDAAVVRSISHILQVKSTDIAFHPERAASLDEYQFELLDYVSMARIERMIREAINLYEPRAKILALDLTAVSDTLPPGIKIGLKVQVVNSNSVLQIDHYLSKVK